MIEILNIFFISLTIFSIFNIKSEKIFKYKNKNIFYIISFNLIIFFNITLFSSFFRMSINMMFYFLVIIFLLSIKNFLHQLKNNYYLLFVFINLALFLKISVDPSLGWDGVTNWYPKAYNFMEGGDFYDLINYNKPTYPHLGTFIWAIFWNYSFLDYEYFGRYIYVFTYLASIFFLISYKKKIDFKNILIIIFLLIITYDLSLFKGYQEFLIFGFINIFVVLFFNEKDNFNLSYITLLIVNILIWIKDEGLIYSLPILILYLLRNKNLFTRENFYFITIFSLIIIFKIFMMNKITYSSELGGFSIEQVINEIFNFDTIFLDILIIGKHFLISFFKYPIWIFLFIFLLFPSQNVKNLKIYKSSKYILFFCLIVNFLIFHIQDIVFLEWHLSTALDRLNMMLSGYFIYFIYLNIEDYFKRYF